MKYIFTLLLVVGLLACETESYSDFCEAIEFNDAIYVKEYVDDILEGRHPLPSAGDPTGHLINFDILIDAINQESCATASLICYECIETYPTQSEIRVLVNDGTFTTVKILDIATPVDAPMYFTGMHD